MHNIQTLIAHASAGHESIVDTTAHQFSASTIIIIVSSLTIIGLVFVVRYLTRSDTTKRASTENEIKTS